MLVGLTTSSDARTCQLEETTYQSQIRTAESYSFPSPDFAAFFPLASQFVLNHRPDVFRPNQRPCLFICSVTLLCSPVISSPSSSLQSLHRLMSSDFSWLHADLHMQARRSPVRNAVLFVRRTLSERLLERSAEHLNEQEKNAS